MKLFLDIETLPTTDAAVIESLSAKITAPANYKKAESIAEWERDNKPQAVLDAVAKTSFDGMYGRICCICYAFDDGPVFSVHGDDETVLLEQFYSHVFDASTDSLRGYAVDVPLTVIGHNVAGFDLPFLKHRSIISRVTPPDAILKAMAARPRDNCIADTMLMWSADREKRASMDKLCLALGMAGKGDFDGSMVAATWPVNPQKVVDYCCADVERTRALYYRMTFDQRGKTADATHAVQQATELPQAPDAITPPTPEEKRAAVIEAQDDIADFINSRSFGTSSPSHVRAILVEFVKFQTERGLKAAA